MSRLIFALSFLLLIITGMPAYAQIGGSQLDGYTGPADCRAKLRNSPQGFHLHARQVNEICDRIVNTQFTQPDVSINNLMAGPNSPGRCMRDGWQALGLTEDEWRNRFSARFIYCLRETMRFATERMITAIMDYSYAITGPAILLAIALFGARVTTGQFHSPKHEFMILMIRIGFVLMVLWLIVDSVDFFYDFVSEVLTLVAEAALTTFQTPGGAPAGMLACKLAPPAGPDGWIVVFDRFDCIFRNMVGFDNRGVGVATTAALFTGIVAFLTAALFTGPMGISILLAGLGAIISAILFVARACMNLVMAFITLSLLLIMVPILIPTVLFKKTQDFILDRVIGMMGAAIVQPAIVVGFFFFALSVIDTLLFVGTPTIFVNPYLAANDPDRIWVMRAPGQTPPNMQYTTAVQPLFNPLGINKNTDTLEQQNDDARKIIQENVKLFNWDINFEQAVIGAMTAQCGDNPSELGEAGNVETNTGAKPPGFWERVTRSLNQLGQFLQEANDDIQYFINNPDEAVREAFQQMGRVLSCVTGKTLDSTNLLQWIEEGAENTIDMFSPRVPQLDLSRAEALDNFVLLADGSYSARDERFPPGIDSDTQALQNIRMQRFMSSLFALLILIWTFSEFMKVIPQIASQITQSRGFAGMPDPPQAVARNMNLMRDGMRRTMDADGGGRGGNALSRMASLDRAIKGGVNSVLAGTGVGKVVTAFRAGVGGRPRPPGI